MLNTLSSFSVRVIMNPVLCDPQWFRETPIDDQTGPIDSVSKTERYDGRGGSSRGRSAFPVQQQRLGNPQFRPFQQPGPSRFGQSSHPQFSGPQFAQVNAMTREQAEGTSGGGIIQGGGSVCSGRHCGNLLVVIVVQRIELLHLHTRIILLSSILLAVPVLLNESTRILCSRTNG
ncbi:hypothetical protein F511_33547 [Dorcoceras hygrometricum]|uniref:Uncharacterized protein n=1 Tax=Dorcoceras hygrometricum TaxID=472368 RepID=A0A2Z7AKR4_9LAMI|nr:hypothetical protein F511_33547 [Dorcoceras hygrometricum]